MHNGHSLRVVRFMVGCHRASDDRRRRGDGDGSVTSERAFGLAILAMALAVTPVMFAAVLLAAKVVL